MKQLVWLLAIVTLFVGRTHYQSNRWGMLAVLLVIDLISTRLINRDLIQQRVDIGNPVKEITESMARQIGDEGKKSGLKAFGFPENVTEAYFMSKDAKEAGEQKFSLTTRIWANIVWTIAIAGLSIYSLIRGF